jgi:murein DD-endopeptidase MepM/ murein hydrolase activator NlpD
MKKISIAIMFVLITAMSISLFSGYSYVERNCEDICISEAQTETESEHQAEPKKDFIKWIDFQVKKEVIASAYKAHKALLQQGTNDIGTCELLAYLAIKNSNKFNSKTDIAILNKLMKQLKNNDRTAIDKYADNKYYKYYVTCFHAVLDGIIDPNTAELTGFHPIAANRWYTEYDDFGNKRGYGYARRHLGHDFFGGVGTPIIAVEGGTVTELGWNRYGGWRVGIRSDDTKRYYYYAHLRKDTPFPEGLEKGSRVNAGDVIGYLGVTGYSRKENTNMTTTRPHLHFGMQIIFDPSQEDGNGEIWIDVYELCKFLSRNRVKV